MKLGLHARALQLASGLGDYKPVGKGALTASQVLEKAAKLGLEAVQLSLANLPDLEMMTLGNLRGKAEELGLLLHLAADSLEGEHVVDTIHAAHLLGATQVTIRLSDLKGNVQERQQRLESLLDELDVAIKRAERYAVMLAIENGRHTAAADLAALVQAAQSSSVGICYDMGNSLTVPEDPVAAAETLAPYVKSIHLKDLQVYRTEMGVALINCPLGEGTLPIVDTLRVLKVRQPQAPIFLQTAASRVDVPLLDDTFLQSYPRITARALAGVLRRGKLHYDPETVQFPHEGKAPEREVLKWEEDRLKKSVKQVHKLIGTASLTLSLG